VADEEQVARLHQGTRAWNEWRRKNPEEIADLTESRILGIQLDGVALNLADCTFTVFERCNLTDAEFIESYLFGVSFIECNLVNTNFDRALLWGAVFVSVDVRSVRGLDTIRYRGPSHVDIDTLRQSQGEIPESLLRGIGLTDHEILFSRLYDPSLTEHEITDILYEVSRLRGTSPIQTHPVFISYSHQDTEFVETLEKKLDQHGIRYWRDVHDLIAGRIESQIDRAMRLNPIVILVLSKHSVNSDWVEWEADKARALEKELGRDVLCPVALDDSWKNCKWPGPLRKQIEKYVVVHHKELDKLIKGLGLHYR
jgi:hypothetical protein